jgi:hypothetical protein
MAKSSVRRRVHGPATGKRVEGLNKESVLMAKSPEQIKQQQQQKSVDDAIECVKLAVENAEKLAHLQLDTARLVLAASVQKAKSVAQPMVAGEIGSSEQVQKMVREAVAYSRQLGEIGQQAQGRLIALAKENQATMDQEFRKAFDRVIEQIPSGDAWAKAVQTMFSAAGPFGQRK